MNDSCYVTRDTWEDTNPKITHHESRFKNGSEDHLRLRRVTVSVPNHSYSKNPSPVFRPSCPAVTLRRKRGHGRYLSSPSSS